MHTSSFSILCSVLIELSFSYYCNFNVWREFYFFAYFVITLFSSSPHLLSHCINNMAKPKQTKKKGPTESVNNKEDPPPKVDECNTIPSVVGFTTPVIRYEGTTGESLPLGNQADNLLPSIPNKYSSPPKQLLPLAQGFHLEDLLEDKVGNQAGILLTQIQDKSSPPLKPPLPLAMVLHPSNPANPYKKK